jgi:hypothetical protein
MGMMVLLGITGLVELDVDGVDTVDVLGERDPKLRRFD